MKIINIAILLGLTIFLNGCVSVPSVSALPKAFFLDKNILSIKVGMTSDEVIELFGNPTNIRTTTCGKKPDTWKCTWWEYGHRYDNNASFTFGGNHGALLLNNYEIDREFKW